MSSDDDSRFDSLADEYLLDRSWTLLNNGSFGACPRPVMERYFALQRELELHPHPILITVPERLKAAREALGGFVGTAADNLAFVTNLTNGANIVADSVELGPGDEVLGTDHEYGAVARAWRCRAGRRGFRYVVAHIPLPATTPEAIVEAIWQGVTPRTRVILFSHITSVTALILPAAEICRRARAAGILTLVDGAHVPGQLPLDLEAVGADYYCATLHKWAACPKGTAFLYARPEAQARIRPLVVGWNWNDEPPAAAHFPRYAQEPGTHDPSRYLAVPEAIRFMREHDWDAIRARCHRLAGDALRRAAALPGAAALHPLEQDAWYSQMASVRLPACDGPRLRKRLNDEYKIETAIQDWHGQAILRISVQAYNRPADIDRLLDVLPKLL